MPLANCRQCGRLFLKAKSSYCSGCQAENDKYYFQLRNYLKTHPKSSVMDVSLNTGIPVSKVLEFQREEYVPFNT